MYKENSTFAQLLQLVDRLGFDNSVKKTFSDKRYRNFTTRTQLAAMIFAQLTKQTGLRSLENSFKAESDLYHPGIKGNISRATLSYANNHRDSKVFEDFYFRLLDDIAVFDRGYFNSLQFNKFCETDIQFVTRIKSNISYSVCDVFGTDGMETNKFIILKDKLIYFSKGKIVKNCSGNTASCNFA